MFWNFLTLKSYQYKTIDWEKVMQLISTYKPDYAIIGMKENWNSTAIVIFKDDTILITSHAQEFTNWATPVILIDGDIIECYKRVDHSYIRNNCNSTWPRNYCSAFYKKYDVNYIDES